MLGKFIRMLGTLLFIDWKLEPLMLIGGWGKIVITDWLLRTLMLIEWMLGTMMIIDPYWVQDKLIVTRPFF